MCDCKKLITLKVKHKDQAVSWVIAQGDSPRAEFMDLFFSWYHGLRMICSDVCSYSYLIAISLLYQQHFCYMFDSCHHLKLHPILLFNCAPPWRSGSFFSLRFLPAMEDEEVEAKEPEDAQGFRATSYYIFEVDS